MAHDFPSLRVMLFALFVIPLMAATSETTFAQTIRFDQPAFSVGNINGQSGWQKTGPFDAAVVASSNPLFEPRALRISNAVTSGSFGDQTFSSSIANEAGETSAANDGMSGGTRQRMFVAEWQFTSAVPGAEQPGLTVTVSPDRGDGARMSYVRMFDAPDGLGVQFIDFQRALGNSCASGDNFVAKSIANGLSRSEVHRIRIEMEFLDGPANDVVRVYVNGVLKVTGTSWEDYFRDCEGNPTRTVDSLLFRTAGSAAPATAGNGFLIDNVNISSSSVPSRVVVRPNDMQGWATDVSAGATTSFVGDSSSPSGFGAFRIKTGPTDASRAELSKAVNVNLADVTELSFTTKQNSTSIPISAPSYAISVLLDGINPAT